MTDKYHAIKALCPGAKFGLQNNEVIWIDEKIKQPTEEQVNDKIAELQAAYEAKQYQRDRALLYPELKEQLDLLFHDMTNGKGDKTGEWYKAVNKVKTDIPKPE